MIDFDKMLFEEDIKQLETLQDAILSAEDEDKEGLLHKIEEAKEKLIRHQRVELKQMEQEAFKTQKELEEKIMTQIIKLKELKEKSKSSEQKNKIAEKIKNYEITLANTPKKINEVLKKHENKMFTELEKVGINVEELRIEPDKRLAVEEERGVPIVKVNVHTGKYILDDTKGQIYEKDIGKKLLKKSTQKKFADYLLKQHIMQRIDSKAESIAFEKELENYILSEGKEKKEREQLKKEYIRNNKNALAKEAVEDYKKYKKKFGLIAEYADINLYTLYVKYDRDNGTNYAQNYIQAIDIENDIVMPTKLNYYVGKDNTDNENKISRKLRKQLLLIANNHEEINIGKVTGNPINKLWEKIKQMLGINKNKMLTLPVSMKNIEKNNEISEYKNKLKIDPIESARINKTDIKNNKKVVVKDEEQNQR